MQLLSSKLPRTCGVTDPRVQTTKVECVSERGCVCVLLPMATKDSDSLLGSVNPRQNSPVKKERETSIVIILKGKIFTEKFVASDGTGTCVLKYGKVGVN